MGCEKSGDGSGETPGGVYRTQRVQDEDRDQLVIVVDNGDARPLTHSGGGARVDGITNNGLEQKSGRARD